MRHTERDNLEGALTYVVSKQGRAWRILRNSRDVTTDDSIDIIEEHPSEGSAKQALWSLKQRNAIRIAATKKKLRTENREQQALLAGIGAWEPPVIEEP